MDPAPGRSPSDPPVRGPLRGRARGRPLSHRPQTTESQEASGSLSQIEQPMENIHLQPAGASVGQVGHEQRSPEEQGMHPPGGVQGETTTSKATFKEDHEVWKKFMIGRDYLRTKPDYLEDKKGTLGQPLNLVANYFPIQMKGNLEWKLRQYRVDFNPEEDNTFTRKVLLKKQKDNLPPYIFDGGNMMYSPVLLPAPVCTFNSTFTKKDGTEVLYELIIKHTRDLSWNDPGAFQFYNIVVRMSLDKSDLTLMGRFYFDHKLKTALHAHRLEIWPGYKTVMRPYEHRLLLNVEMVSKVVRTDTVLQVMQQIRNSGDRETFRPRMEEAICGRVVMTSYNRKTYSIAGIVWGAKVTDVFETKNGPVTYIDYYGTRYGLQITETGQPLLIAQPSKKDIHRIGQKDILLVPELCQLTGLTEQMRSDFRLMGELKNHLIQEPAKRVDQIQTFMRSMVENTDLKAELTKWGVRYGTDELIDVPGRRLDGEKILFKNLQEARSLQNSWDWTSAFRNSKLYATVPMKKWGLIVPQRDAQNVDNLIRTIKNVSTPLEFMIDPPKVKTINGIGGPIYCRAIDDLMTDAGGNIDMIFIILPNNNPTLYATVKRKCAVDYGVSSQCFLKKNADKANMSVCTKVAIQMCAKLGGEPWIISNPLHKGNCMVVGYDVYHSGPGGASGQKSSVGSMVASLNGTVSRYTSSVTMAQKSELSSTIGAEFMKLLLQYEKVNSVLPSRIIFYRDGVGEGQLNQVQDVEITSIDTILESLYRQKGLEVPKFTFIVVSKRINTRFMQKSGARGRHEYTNPLPGSIVDDVVTLPERYDFFLVSQSARQGTVSPTSYNVLKDHPSLKPNHLQVFTFKMCHLYYNWSGTVSVPAVCQYAHKLAYLTGLSINAPAHSNLANLLHFL